MVERFNLGLSTSFADWVRSRTVSAFAVVGIAGGMMLAGTDSASAALIALNESTANWMLNLYVPDNVDVWWTGASQPCAANQGHLTFGTNASQDDKNRFWSMVLTAKSTGKNMIIWYDDQTCQIASFNMQ